MKEVVLKIKIKSTVDEDKSAKDKYVVNLLAAYFGEDKEQILRVLGVNMLHCFDIDSCKIYAVL